MKSQIIGQRIKQAREDRGLTLKELAEILGLTESTLSRYESGIVKSIKLPIIQSIAQILNVNEMWILNKSEERMRIPKAQIIQIPLVGTVAAGTPILAEENIEDYFAIDRQVKADFALRVKGDSMIDASIFDGDIAFIKKQSDLENGEIGAILIDNEATLKRFYRDKGTIILQAENRDIPGWPRVFTNGNLMILGKLVGIYSRR